MNQTKKINKFKFKIFEAILYVVGYTIAFFLVSKIFDSFKLDQNHPMFFAFLSVLIIIVLNKTIKPILTFFTIPITASTLGLFYFVLNTFILKIVDFILLDKLNFTNIWILFFISIILSAINLFIELLIIKPIIKRMKLNG